MWYVSCCLMPLFGASATHASPDIKPSAKAITGNAASLGKLSTTAYHPELKATPMVASDIFVTAILPSKICVSGSFPKFPIKLTLFKPLIV